MPISDETKELLGSKALYRVKTTVFNRVANAEHVLNGALEGRTVPPFVVTHHEGDTVELFERDAKHHLAADAIEGPVEVPKPAEAKPPAK